MRFGLLLYDGVEPIDLAAFGVLSMARRIRPEIALATLAERAGPVTLANGIVVLAEHALAEAPPLDWLVVPGGPGWVAAAEAPAIHDFLRAQAARGPIASICTGAMILAASGLLDRRPATTKREVVPPEESPLHRLAAAYPTVTAREAVYVDSGAIVTGGGVALAIDTMLHVLARAFGEAVAAETARILEYDRARAANRAALPPVIQSD
ncbi:MAG: DJ-1/PfpI family protein [Rhodospirillales bacterium]|nr:DJ-1/PfpI family protein [Rhodospirillales bacterium]